MSQFVERGRAGVVNSSRQGEEKAGERPRSLAANLFASYIRRYASFTGEPRTAAVDDLLDVLPRVFFLHDQDDTTRRSFAELAVCRTYPKGNILFHHGDPCFAAYVIINGRIKLTVADDDGREFALEVFGPGDVAGLIAALDGGANNGTAITLSPCRVAIVPRERFQAWITAHPLLLHTIVGALVRMLRGVYERAGMQALLPVKRRVRAALIEVAQNDGVLDGGQEYVAPRPTHQELAERIGSTRVVVSRVMKELLEEETWIRMDGRTLRVRQDFGETRVR